MNLSSSQVLEQNEISTHEMESDELDLIEMDEIPLTRKSASVREIVIVKRRSYEENNYGVEP